MSVSSSQKRGVALTAGGTFDIRAHSESLADPNFHAPDFLNRFLGSAQHPTDSSTVPEQDLDAQLKDVMTLVSQVQWARDSANSRVQEASNHLFQLVPRIAKEVEDIEGQTDTLREVLDRVSSQVGRGLPQSPENHQADQEGDQKLQQLESIQNSTTLRLLRELDEVRLSLADAERILTHLRDWQSSSRALENSLTGSGIPKLLGSGRGTKDSAASEASSAAEDQPSEEDVDIAALLSMDPQSLLRCSERVLRLRELLHGIPDSVPGNKKRRETLRSLSSQTEKIAAAHFAKRIQTFFSANKSPSPQETYVAAQIIHAASTGFTRKGVEHSAEHPGSAEAALDQLRELPGFSDLELLVTVFQNIGREASAASVYVQSRVSGIAAALQESKPLLLEKQTQSLGATLDSIAAQLQADRILLLVLFAFSGPDPRVWRNANGSVRLQESRLRSDSFRLELEQGRPGKPGFERDTASTGLAWLALRKLVHRVSQDLDAVLRELLPSGGGAQLLPAVLESLHGFLRNVSETSGAAQVPPAGEAETNQDGKPGVAKIPSAWMYPFGRALVRPLQAALFLPQASTLSSGNLYSPKQRLEILRSFGTNENDFSVEAAVQQLQETLVDEFLAAENSQAGAVNPEIPAKQLGRVFRKVFDGLQKYLEFTDQVSGGALLLVALELTVSEIQSLLDATTELLRIFAIAFSGKSTSRPAVFQDGIPGFPYLAHRPSVQGGSGQPLQELQEVVSEICSLSGSSAQQAAGSGGQETNPSSEHDPVALPVGPKSNTRALETSSETSATSSVDAPKIFRHRFQPPQKISAAGEGEADEAVRQMRLATARGIMRVLELDLLPLFRSLETLFRDRFLPLGEAVLQNSESGSSVDRWSDVFEVLGERLQWLETTQHLRVPAQASSGASKLFPAAVSSDRTGQQNPEAQETLAEWRSFLNSGLASDVPSASPAVSSDPVLSVGALLFYPAFPSFGEFAGQPQRSRSFGGPEDQDPLLSWGLGLDLREEKGEAPVDPATAVVEVRNQTRNLLIRFRAAIASENSSEVLLLQPLAGKLDDLRLESLRLVVSAVYSPFREMLDRLSSAEIRDSVYGGGGGYSEGEGQFSPVPSQLVSEIAERLFACVQELDPESSQGSPSPQLEAGGSLVDMARTALLLLAEELIADLVQIVQELRNHQETPISQQGERQLKADLEYLGKVIRAVAAPPENILQPFLDLTEQ